MYWFKNSKHKLKTTYGDDYLCSNIFNIILTKPKQECYINLNENWSKPLMAKKLRNNQNKGCSYFKWFIIPN